MFYAQCLGLALAFLGVFDFSVFRTYFGHAKLIAPKEFIFICFFKSTMNTKFFEAKTEMDNFLFQHFSSAIYLGHSLFLGTIMQLPEFLPFSGNKLERNFLRISFYCF